MIKSGKYEFHKKEWLHVSEEAKDLVRRMLVVNRDPAKGESRATLDQVLKHPWLLHKSRENPVDLLETISRLRKFNAKRKLKAAAMIVMWGTRFNFQERKTLKAMLQSNEAHVFDLKQLGKIRAAFKHHANAHNRVALDQFKEVMRELGFQDGPLERMFFVSDHAGRYVLHRLVDVWLCKFSINISHPHQSHINPKTPHTEEPSATKTS